MSESHTGKGRLRGLELEREVVNLRLAGLTFDTIARNLGCSVGGAHKACMRAIKRYQDKVAEGAGEMVTLELQRLDRMWNVLWLKVLEGNMSAMDRCLHIMERRAKLLGLDASMKAELTGKDGGPIQYEYDYSHLSDEELERQYQAVVVEAESATRGAAAEADES